MTILDFNTLGSKTPRISLDTSVCVSPCLCIQAVDLPLRERYRSPMDITNLESNFFTVLSTGTHACTVYLPKTHSMYSLRAAHAWVSVNH
jgi:hypothetical protein